MGDHRCLENTEAGCEVVSRRLIRTETRGDEYL